MRILASQARAVNRRPHSHDSLSPLQTYSEVRISSFGAKLYTIVRQFHNNSYNNLHTKSLQNDFDVEKVRPSIRLESPRFLDSFYLQIFNVQMTHAQNISGCAFEWPVGLGTVSNTASAQSVDLRSASGFQHTVQTFRPDQQLPSLAISVGSLSANLQVESFQSMDVVSEADQGSIYEPVRLVANAAPPKRFYRTFWRSAARRMLSQKDTQKLEGIWYRQPMEQEGHKADLHCE